MQSSLSRLLRWVLGSVLLADLNSRAASLLSVDNAPGYPGATVPLTIRMAHTTNVVGAQFDLNFNPDKVASGPMLPGGGFSNNIVRSREVAPGVRRVIAYSLLNKPITITNSGVIGNVPFVVSSSERIGSGPISATNVILARGDATAVSPVAVSAGQIFLRPVNALPDGKVEFFLSSQADQLYLIQATTNFLNWVNLTNITAFGDFMDLMDPDAASYPYRFYRSVPGATLGQLGSLTLGPDGNVQLQITGLAGRSYVLQISRNLRDWQSVSTNVATAGALTVTTANAGNAPSLFYRLKSD
jgi:hypothetical protein